MIGSSENRISYNGNGIATEFAYTFKILEKSDMKVLHVANDGTEELLTKDYYVDMEKSVVLYPGYAPGAEIPEQNRPPILPVGERLVLYREVPITQESALDKHWPFNVIEAGLDKLTIICQQIWDRANRSFYVSPATNKDFNGEVPIAPGKTFRVKDDGTGFEVTEDPGKVIDGAKALLKQTTEQAVNAQNAATNAQNAANAAEAVAPEYAKTKEVLDNIVSYTNTATEQASIATAKADAANTSATNAAQSYANADAVATQLTEYLATKETLTAPAVDKTLLIEGAAADSSKVGVLKDAFGEMCDTLFSGEATNNQVLFARYEAPIGSTVIYDFTVPEDAGAILQFISTKDSSVLFSVGKNYEVANPAQHFFGSTFVPEDFFYARIAITNIDTININKISVVVKREYDAISNEIEMCNDFRENAANYYKPTNLFNKDSSLLKKGYVVRGSGDYIALSGSCVTHPIKIKANTTYCFTANVNYYGSDIAKVVKYVNKNGEIIAVHNSTNLSEDGKYVIFNIENLTTEYVCVNVRESDLATFVFAEGETLPEYTPYFEPYYKLKPSVLPETPVAENIQQNILYGKKLALNGDSICYGAGAAGGYGSIIAANNNMIVSNIAVAGGTIASGTKNSAGGNRHWISETIAQMPADYDYYIIEGGVNDASGDVGVQLGSLTSTYLDTLDKTTMLGAMESICKELQLTFKGKKYGFIFPHNCFDYTAKWNTDFRPAMKSALKKWGIPYLDLSEECPQLRNLDALRIYTANNDGWHPNEEGYKKYYVPKIEAWLKTL